MGQGSCTSIKLIKIRILKFTKIAIQSVGEAVKLMEV